MKALRNRGLVALTGVLCLGLAASKSQAAQAVPPSGPGGGTTLVDLALSLRERVRLQAQAERARERLKTLAREADALASQQRTVLGQLRQWELRREQALVQVEAARASETLARAAVTDTARQIRAIEAKVAERAPAVRARLHRLYKLGQLDSPRYWIRADGLVQTARAWRLLATLASRDRQVLVEAASDRAALEALRSAQGRHVEETERLAREARVAAAAAVEAVASREALLRRLDGERDLAARLVGELQTAEERLRHLLSAPLSAADPGGEQAVALLPLAAFKGDFDWPVAGRVAAPFGEQRDARFGTVLPRKGVEIAAPEHAPVVALHEGRVVFADEFAGLGRLVIVDHGGNAFSLYGHLGAFTVSRGDTVARGTRVGAAGPPVPGAAGTYFELRIDGQPVDPLEWLKPFASSARPQVRTP
ncbi:MAG: murein hydrolase activator EnvC [Vicinamibacterales bacterium]